MAQLKLPRLLLVACSLAPLAAWADDPALDLLRASAAKYRAVETFLIEGDIRAEVRVGSRNQSSTGSFRVAVGGPGKMRDELDHPEAGATWVSNGKESWLYLPGVNQYAHRKDTSALDLSRAGGMLGVLLATLRGAAEGVDSVHALPDDHIPFEGSERRCAVFEVVYKAPEGTGGAPVAPRIFWIDRKSRLVLQHRTVSRGTTPDGTQTVEQSETFRYRRISLGQPVEPSLFSFAPPQGAVLVEEFGARPKAESLAGQAAADFTLPDLSGKRHSLKAQRGKVVMLDFWASWCGPCRVQMPLVEKLSQELKQKGLVVYAVNQGESAETARRYLEKNKYATTTLLDQEQVVGRQYKAVGIPTLVVIDREGKISAHFVGVRSEAALRGALEKAGL